MTNADLRAELLPGLRCLAHDYNEEVALFLEIGIQHEDVQCGQIREHLQFFQPFHPIAAALLDRKRHTSQTNPDTFQRVHAMFIASILRIILENVGSGWLSEFDDNNRPENGCNIQSHGNTRFGKKKQTQKRKKRKVNR